MNYFSHIQGNDTVKQHLVKMVEKDAVPHSLLFAGPQGIGKGLFAKAFAELLLTDGSTSQHNKVQKEIHPDLHIYRPEGKIGMHSIDSMRQLTHEIYLAPFEAKRKVFILHDAERMLSYSANALLKTFEEPSLDSVIILLSSSPENLLPTIRSRFQTVYFQKTENITSCEDSPLQQKLAALLSAGHFATYGKLLETVKQIADQIEQTKQQVEKELKGASNTENLTAAQRESVEKEIEGLVSLQANRESTNLLNLILGWYRDQELLSVNGNPAFLFHRDYQHHLEQSIQRNNVLSIEYVQKAVSDAKRSLERSSPIGIVLENLFLKLNFYSVSR